MNKFKKYFLLSAIIILTACPKQVDINNEWKTFGYSQARNNNYPIAVKPPFNLKWKFKTEGRILYPPIATQKAVYFGSRDGNIYSLGLDGSPLWKYNMTKGGMYHSLTLNGNVLYTGSWAPPHSLIALDSQSGNLLFSLETGEIEDLPVVVTTENNIIYFNTDEMDPKPSFSLPKTIVSLQSVDVTTGNINWKIPFDGRFVTPAAISEDTIYTATSSENNLYALDSLTGNIKWKYEFSGETVCTPAVDKDNVYINDKSGYIYCINKLTGVLLWRYKLEAEIYSSMAIADGLIFISANDGYLYCFDIKNTELKWKYKSSKPFAANPVVSGNYVYIGGLDDFIYAIDRETGRVAWSYKTGDDIEAGVAIVNKMLFVGSADGYLYAFEEVKTK